MAATRLTLLLSRLYYRHTEMGCFSVLWLIQTLIWIVVVCGIVAIIMILLPIALSWLGWAGEVAMRILRIIVAVIVIVALLWLCYDLYVCAVGGGGLRVR